MSSQSRASLLAGPHSEHCFYKPLVSHSHAYVLPRRPIGVRGSRKTSSHTLQCVLILGRTRPCLDEPLEILAALSRQMGFSFLEDETMLRETLEDHHSSPSAEVHIRVVLARKACEGQNTQEKDERLMVTSGHIFKDVMANYHPLDIAAEVCGKSSNSQWAFQQLWK